MSNFKKILRNNLISYENNTLKHLRNNAKFEALLVDNNLSSTEVNIEDYLKTIAH